MTFRIVNSDLSMVDIVRFLQNHPARIEGEKFFFHLFQVFDIQTDMMKSRFHTHLTKRRAFLEKGEVIKSVGDRNISLRRTAKFFSSKKAMVEIGELFGIFADVCDVAKSCHGQNPPRALE